MAVQVYGVLSRVLGEQIKRGRFPQTVPGVNGRVPSPVKKINADLLLTRLWVGSDNQQTKTELANEHLATVAAACGAVDPRLLDALHQRRRRALEQIAGRHSPQWECRELRLQPMWRVVVGHGEDSVHETSLTMSPTYGVPVFPGSALKGLAAAYARQLEVPAEAMVRLFGSPRPGAPTEKARQGSVVVLDALPAQPPHVVVDVLTPHVKPYYDTAHDNGQPTQPPAEYHNPVPVRFLAVEQTPFRALLAGPREDLTQFADLLDHAVGELGLGGKTAAGYGYFEEPGS